MLCIPCPALLSSSLGRRARYVGSLGKFPELRVIGALWWVWPTLTSLAVYHYFGYYNMVLYCTSPMLLARLVTLIFNVECAEAPF